MEVSDEGMETEMAESQNSSQHNERSESLLGELEENTSYSTSALIGRGVCWEQLKDETSEKNFIKEHSILSKQSEDEYTSTNLVFSESLQNSLCASISKKETRNQRLLRSGKTQNTAVALECENFQELNEEPSDSDDSCIKTRQDNIRGGFRRRRRNVEREGRSTSDFQDILNSSTESVNKSKTSASPNDSRKLILPVISKRKLSAFRSKKKVSEMKNSRSGDTKTSDFLSAFNSTNESLNRSQISMNTREDSVSSFITIKESNILFPKKKRSKNNSSQPGDIKILEYKSAFDSTDESVDRSKISVSQNNGEVSISSVSNQDRSRALVTEERLSASRTSSPGASKRSASFDNRKEPVSSEICSPPPKKDSRLSESEKLNTSSSKADCFKNISCTNESLNNEILHEPENDNCVNEIEANESSKNASEFEKQGNDKLSNAEFEDIGHNNQTLKEVNTSLLTENNHVSQTNLPMELDADAVENDSPSRSYISQISVQPSSFTNLGDISRNALEKPDSPSTLVSGLHYYDSMESSSESEDENVAENPKVRNGKYQLKEKLKKNKENDSENFRKSQDDRNEEKTDEPVNKEQSDDPTSDYFEGNERSCHSMSGSKINQTSSVCISEIHDNCNSMEITKDSISEKNNSVNIAVVEKGSFKVPTLNDVSLRNRSSRSQLLRRRNSKDAQNKSADKSVLSEQNVSYSRAKRTPSKTRSDKTPSRNLSRSKTETPSFGSIERQLSVPFSELKKKRNTADNKENNDYILAKKLLSFENNEKANLNLVPVSNKGIKLLKPKRWVSDHLYNFIITKLEPKYDFKARKRAETFVFYLCKKFDIVKKEKVEFKKHVDELILEMARLQLIVNLYDFYDFVDTFLPLSFFEKSVPCIRLFGQPNIVAAPPRGTLLNNIL